jgi:hypothetical protein
MVDPTLVGLETLSNFLLARQTDGMALEKKWLMEYPQCLYTAARRSSGASHEPIGNDDSAD